MPFRCWRRLDFLKLGLYMDVTMVINPILIGIYNSCEQYTGIPYNYGDVSIYDWNCRSPSRGKRDEKWAPNWIVGTLSELEVSSFFPQRPLVFWYVLAYGYD